MAELHERAHGTPTEALLWSVHDIITQVVMHRLRPSLKRAGVSWEQFLTLHIVSSHRSTSVSDVAQHLGISPPTACVSVDRLEALGLVQRKRTEQNRRTVEIRITPRGRSIERRVWTQIGRLTTLAAEGTPASDIETAARVLRRLVQRLESSPPGETP